jgi:hypothetical protein
MVSVELRGHVRPVVAPLSTDRADAWQPFVGRPAPDRLRGDVQQARYLDGPEQLVILWLVVDASSRALRRETGDDALALSAGRSGLAFLVGRSCSRRY